MDFRSSAKTCRPCRNWPVISPRRMSPHADQWDKEHHFPGRDRATDGRARLFGCPIKEEYGGTDRGYLARVVLCEEVAKGSSSLRVAFNTQCLGTALSIQRHGTEEQKKKWIPDLIASRKLASSPSSNPTPGRTRYPWSPWPSPTRTDSSSTAPRPGSRWRPSPACWPSSTPTRQSAGSRTGRAWWTCTPTE